VLQAPDQRSAAAPGEDRTGTGSGACEGDHGGAGISVRRKSGKYGYLPLHSMRGEK